MLQIPSEIFILLEDNHSNVTTIKITVKYVDGTESSKGIKIEHMKNLGMSYRDPPDEDKIDEYLEMLGAEYQSRDTLPTFGPKPNYLITTNSTMQVTSSTTAGESEFVMYPTDEELYIGVGNDHKEYDIMPEKATLSNSTCPSVVSDEFWVYEEIADHWDELYLRSWVEDEGTLKPYQKAPMSAFMRPDRIVKAVDEGTTHPITGTAIWSGTITRTTKTGEGGVDPFPDVISGDFYLIQLIDPVLDRRLVTYYDVRESN